MHIGPGQTKALAFAGPTLLLTQTLSGVLFGRLSDFVGRRWVFIGGNLVACVGFVATGRVDNGSTVTGLVRYVFIRCHIAGSNPVLTIE